MALALGAEKEEAEEQQGCGALLPRNLSCGKPRKRIELDWRVTSPHVNFVILIPVCNKQGTASTNFHAPLVVVQQEVPLVLITVPPCKGETRGIVVFSYGLLHCSARTSRKSQTWKHFVQKTTNKSGL